MRILLHVSHYRGSSLAEEAVGRVKHACAADRRVVAHFDSRHADSDVDVPPCGLGIGTRQVRGIYPGLGDFAPYPGQADVEARFEEVLAVVVAQVHFSIDGRISRETGPHFGRRKPHCTHETGRPTGGEQLLRISSLLKNPLATAMA
jgi:hypothetical protein